MSARNEQELLDEIQYLTKLIKSHGNKVTAHKKSGTSSRGNADVYRWTNRAATNATTPKESKSSKALHHNATAGIQSKMHTYRHPMLQAAGQGRFVYNPKQSLTLPLNKNKHSESSALLSPMAAATLQVVQSKPSEGDYLRKTEASERSTGDKHKVQHSSSQFNLYDGAAQSAKKSTVKGTSSKGVSMNPPESKSPASYTSTSSVTSTKRSDADGHVSCSHSGHSDSRKRKRTVSASRQLTSAVKKHRSQHSSVLKSSRYVWLPKNTSQKYKTDPQVLKQHPPNSSQFMLEASADQPKDKEAKASPIATTPTVKSPTVKRTPNLSSVPVAVSTSNRKMCKGTSRVRTPVNSKYKWRRRLSSSGSRKVQRILSSPLVVQSRYKLTRASLLEKHPATSSRKRFSSFTQRRVDYLLKNSPHPYTTKQLHLKGSTSIRARPAKSKNKVWVASSGKDTDSEEPLDLAVQPLQTLASGRESKTRQGNKQWVATHARNPARGMRTRKRSTHTRKQLGLRSPLAVSSKVVMDASGRRMTRIPSSSRLTWRRTSTSGSLSVNRMLASHAVRRSKAYVWHAKQRSKHHGKSKQYCMFFNRFGKCNKMATCPYIHDPDKVAICTKFLRGTCDRTNGTCPFSHKISKDKMPVCSFFLRGVCTRDDCPYAHVSVGRDAEVCQDFLRGYCPRGEQCTKLHTLDCPEFFRTGSCSRGSACPMRHRRRSSKPSQQGSATTVKEPYAFKKARHRKEHTTSRCRLPSSGRDDSVLITPAELDFIPLDQDFAPDFIAL